MVLHSDGHLFPQPRLVVRPYTRKRATSRRAVLLAAPQGPSRDADENVVGNYN
jgi:hypothetical protein